MLVGRLGVVILGFERPHLEALSFRYPRNVNVQVMHWGIGKQAVNSIGL